MRDFVFVKRSDSQKATIRVDMVDNNVEQLTVMWCDGVRGTEFEKILPWKCGSVTSMTDIETWVQNYQAEYDVYMYGGSQIKKLGSPTHKLTVTATITGEGPAKVVLKGTKEGALSISDEIEFANGVAKEIEGIEGYTYTWEVSGKVSWTSDAPEAFVCTEDKVISLEITVS